MKLEALGAAFWPRVERVLRELGAPDAAPREPIIGYLDAIARWNAKMDLTAASDADELVDLFVADAAVLAAHAEPGARWVDVGSGAGAPGLMLAILAPQLSLTLVEPKRRRVAFLRTVVGELGLRNVRVIASRSDALAGDCADVAVSRATLAPPDWLREGARLAPRVWVLLAKEPAPELEGWSAVSEREYAWPLRGRPRRAVAYGRVADP